MTRVSGKACPFCFKEGTLRPICTEGFVHRGVPFTCTGCGGSYFQRTIADSDADEYWGDDSVNETVYTEPEVRGAFRRKYERYLSLLDRGKNPESNEQSLLEIGCGSGIFLETAARRGWKVSGVDVSPEAIRIAKQYCPDATVVCAQVEKAGFAEGAFDLVALWDVIEHVVDPEELLCEAHRLLRPGGLLVLETPDEGCLARKLVRFVHSLTAGHQSYLYAMYYRDHRWYFSREAMAIVLRRVGFDAIRFFSETTVKEFATRKANAYGLRSVTPILSLLGVVPWFRNKMVVMAKIAGPLAKATRI